MAEFVYNEIQLVQPGAPALLEDGIRCNRGLVLHRPGSGILTLRGSNGGCQQFARYRVAFDGNIAVPEDGTVGEIQLALAIDGEIVPTSIAAATPTVVDAYFNVSGFAIVDVPACCCYTVSVRNASEGATAAAVPPALNLRNLNVEVTRIA